MIPYSTQSIDETDIEAVSAILRSGWLTQGPAIERFEQAVANYCGAKYAVAVANATAGLHIAGLALGLGPGKRLWTSPNTFVASANCARYCGAEVDFVDIDPGTLNLSVENLRIKLEQARTNSTLPDIVVPVHFGGLPCDMEAIAALSREYGFHILEDAAHALSAKYHGHFVGDLAFSKAVVLSFHAVKIITSAEGGMILTNDKELARHLRSLRSHGITREPQAMRGPSEGGWYYQQTELGFHYRITDLQAALGTSQLERIADLQAKRQFLADRYHEKLAGLPVRLQEQPEGYTSAWHLFVVRVDAAKRRQIFDFLRAEKIGVNVHYIPVHLQPYYQDLGFKAGDYPAAEQYYAEAISLPLHPKLTVEEQDLVIDLLKTALKA